MTLQVYLPPTIATHREIEHEAINIEDISIAIIAHQSINLKIVPDKEYQSNESSRNPIAVLSTNDDQFEIVDWRRRPRFDVPREAHYHVR